jgi:hypothetical protein
MAGTLADRDQTLLLLVTLPEELPTTETLDTVAWVDRSGVVGSPIIVANRVLTELRLKPPTSGMGADIARLHQSLWEEQQIWLEKLLPDLSLPYMFGLFTPPEVAAHISDELEALR